MEASSRTTKLREELNSSGGRSRNVSPLFLQPPQLQELHFYLVFSASYLQLSCTLLLLSATHTHPCKAHTDLCTESPSSPGPWLLSRCGYKHHFTASWAMLRKHWSLCSRDSNYWFFWISKAGKFHKVSIYLLVRYLRQTKGFKSVSRNRRNKLMMAKKTTQAPHILIKHSLKVTSWVWLLVSLYRTCYNTKHLDIPQLSQL